MVAGKLAKNNSDSKLSDTSRPEEERINLALGAEKMP